MSVAKAVNVMILGRKWREGWRAVRVWMLEGGVGGDGKGGGVTIRLRNTKTRSQRPR